jgi:hypothetical protein
VKEPRSGGWPKAPANLDRVYTLGLDTIAGSKLLQLKFGPFGVFQPDQTVMHGDRRARFIRISAGAAVIQHLGNSRPDAVPPESLSLPPKEPRCAALPAPAGAAARQGGPASDRSRLAVRAGWGGLPRHPAQRRPPLRP